MINEIQKYLNQCIEHYEALERLGKLQQHERNYLDVYKSIKDKVVGLTCARLLQFTPHGVNCGKWMLDEGRVSRLSWEGAKRAHVGTLGALATCVPTYGALRRRGLEEQMLN